jgi:hypothetical protein
MKVKIETPRNSAKVASNNKASFANIDTTIEAAIENTMRLKEKYASPLEGSWMFLNLGTIM